MYYNKVEISGVNTSQLKVLRESEKMELLKKFTMRAHSSIFANHLAMLHRKWRNSLIDLGCDDIYFYHLPSQYVDGFGYRDRALRNWEKYKDLFPGARLLTYEPK